MSWQEHAACVGAPFEWFFPSSENFVDPRAKALCDICTVLPDCAEHARNEPYGYRAHMTPADRGYKRSGVSATPDHNRRRRETGNRIETHVAGTSGPWTVTSICRDVGCARETARDHLDAMTKAGTLDKRDGSGNTKEVWVRP